MKVAKAYDDKTAQARQICIVLLYSALMLCALMYGVYEPLKLEWRYLLQLNSLAEWAFLKTIIVILKNHKELNKMSVLPIVCHLQTAFTISLIVLLITDETTIALLCCETIFFTVYLQLKSKLTKASFDRCC